MKTLIIILAIVLSATFATFAFSQNTALTVQELQTMLKGVKSQGAKLDGEYRATRKIIDWQIMKIQQDIQALKKKKSKVKEMSNEN